MALWTYCLIIAVGIFIVEMFTGTIYLLVLSFAFLGGALNAYFFPQAIGGSMLVVAILSILGTLFVYYKLQNLTPAQEEQDQNINDLDIGQVVRIEKNLNQGYWQVFYRGAIWEAQSIDNQHIFQHGEQAVICGKNGATLLISMISFTSH